MGKKKPIENGVLSSTYPECLASRPLAPPNTYHRIYFIHDKTSERREEKLTLFLALICEALFYLFLASPIMEKKDV